MLGPKAMLIVTDSTAEITVTETATHNTTDLIDGEVSRGFVGSQRECSGWQAIMLLHDDIDPQILVAIEGQWPGILTISPRNTRISLCLCTTGIHQFFHTGMMQQ